VRRHEPFDQEMWRTESRLMGQKSGETQREKSGMQEKKGNFVAASLPTKGERIGEHVSPAREGEQSYAPGKQGKWFRDETITSHT